MLIVFAGLPGVGKTTIAKELARQIGAVYLRIDTIEQAVARPPLDDIGYRVAYAVAFDNLHLGRTVIADCVNPIDVTRDAWVAVARRAEVPHLEIEIVCSDLNEHRRRVESRDSPTWADVVSREYAAWEHPILQIDTASSTVEQSVRIIRDQVVA